MKKWFCALLFICLLLSLTACGSRTSNADTTAETTPVPETTTVPETSTAAETTKATETTTVPETSTTAETTTVPETTTEVLSVTPEEVEAAIARVMGKGYKCTVQVSQEDIPVSFIGGMDLDKIKSCVVKQTTIPSVNLDVVVVVECQEGYEQEAVEVLNQSYAQSLSYIRMYPFGVAMVQGARLYQSGNLIMFIMTGSETEAELSEEEAARLAAEDYEKIDAALKELLGFLPENLAIKE